MWMNNILSGKEPSLLLSSLWIGNVRKNTNFGVGITSLEGNWNRICRNGLRLFSWQGQNRSGGSRCRLAWRESLVWGRVSETKNSQCCVILPRTFFYKKNDKRSSCLIYSYWVEGSNLLDVIQEAWLFPCNIPFFILAFLVDLAANSLLNKLIRQSLVESSHRVEVLQKDPSSPLYSVKTFEELRLWVLVP